MKKALILLLLVVVIIGGFFALRFLFGGDEDTWICENGVWIKHGNPSAPKPVDGCGVKVPLVEDTKDKLYDMSICVSQNGNQMDYEEARKIAEEGCKEGSLKEEHSCNDYTGTWWIDFTPNEPKDGCNPACVVNVETKEAEINWRCTGLMQED